MEEKYGELTINDGTYAWKIFKRNHPLSYLISKIPRRRKSRIPKIAYSDKANWQWWNEKVNSSEKVHLYDKYEKYLGQESTVFNFYNEIIPYPTINTVVAEELTRNKFLQYRILKDSEVSEAVPPTVLVGLGSGDEKEIDALLEYGKSFVIKPILGIQGKGVKIINRKNVEKFKYQRGPIKSNYSWKEYLRMFKGTMETQTYLEDLIEEGDFSFESVVSVIQPNLQFNLKRKKKSHTSIRAIICNGQFIDAYERVGKFPVNLSRGARAKKILRKGDLGEFCEKVIRTYEERCAKYDPETFYFVLYGEYLTERGRTTFSKRHQDLIWEKNSLLSSVLDKILAAAKTK